MSRDPRIAAMIEKVLAKSPFAGSLGIELVAWEAERVSFRLPFRPGNVTIGNVVHGGAIAALADVAGAAGSASAVDPEKVSGGATSSLTISYLAPADGCDLIAEAVVIQRSASQTVSDVSVRDPGGRLVAKAIVTSRIFGKGG